MCCGTKGVQSTVFVNNSGNTTKVFLNSSKEQALEVNIVLCKWVGKWLPFTCRTEIIRVGLGGFRGGCRGSSEKGRVRVCGRDIEDIRNERIDCGRNIVW